MSTEPRSSADEHLTGGPLSAAISNAMVGIQREYLGRGPTKARTVLSENTVMVLMEDTLTRAEHSLVADGKSDEVLRTRASFQQTMRHDMIDVVERLCGRGVIAFMSTNHIEPDLACEILVLEPDVFAHDDLARRDAAL